MNSEKVDFGFKKVNREEKSNLVKGIFSGVAKKYDLMNDLMSAGVHRIWKDKMIEEINLKSCQNALDGSDPIKVIDLAGGTGDIAFRIAKKASMLRGLNTEKGSNPFIKIDIVDINQEMLDVGKKRAIDLNLFSDLTFTCADGENLAFLDNSFDFFTISFGIRNFTDINAGLKEAFRVLKPGGKFICLEFSKVNDYFLQKIYDTYSFKIIPKIGEVILKDRDSYQYLVESIRKFPDQEKFKKMIETVGFKNVSYKNLSFGAAAIHVGYKI
jgi:demethylmenaquinone methyltransferase/2-methoxy-6-polyprenyl-1,4-benzoquinol methylase